MRHMGEICPFGLYAIDDLEGLTHREMRVVSLPAQGIYYQYLYSLKFCLLMGLNVTEVGEVCHLAKTVAHRAETVGVVTHDGYYLHAFDHEWRAGLYGVQLDDRHAAILVLGKGVVILHLHAVDGGLVAVDMCRVNGGVVHEVEGAHIVDASGVVLVHVREEYCIYVRHALAQHLIAEVGARVYDETLALDLDHCRGAQTPVAPIRGATYLAFAAYYGYALRCSSA